jgi:hypothetical protein
MPNNPDLLLLNLRHQGGLDPVAEAIRHLADQAGLILEKYEAACDPPHSPTPLRTEVLTWIR